MLILVWVAAFFIPSGQYKLDASGSPVVGSYGLVPPPLDFGGRVRDLLLAREWHVRNQDPATGQVGPFNKGTMFGSVEVFLFILSIGGFMTVVFATGALDLGIHHLSYRFRDRGPLLIVVLSVLFGVLGLDQGLERRDPRPLRHDGSADDRARIRPPCHGRGRHSRTVRRRAGIDDQSVCHGHRVIEGRRQYRRWHRPAAAAVRADDSGDDFQTLWYARRVKADPARSLCGISDEDAALARTDSGPARPLSGVQAGVISLVFATFGLLAFAIVPWGAILNNAGVDPYTEKTINSPLWWSSAGGFPNSQPCSLSWPLSWGS